MKFVVRSVLEDASGKADSELVRLRFLECLDHEFKFEDVEVTAINGGGKLDLTLVPEWFISDVKEFIAENRQNRKICGEVVEELTQVEFLNYWLHWNGVIGYGSSIVELVEALGWRPTWKK